MAMCDKTTHGCKKLYERVLEYNADCIEWCPVQRNAHMMLCGTYQLKEADENMTGPGNSDKNKRIGKLYTFKLNSMSNLTNYERSDDKMVYNETQNITNKNQNNLLVLARECEMPGILDVKWSYHEIQGRIMYAIANAHGHLTLWAENSEEKEEEVTGKETYDKKEDVKKEDVDNKQNVKEMRHTSVNNYDKVIKSNDKNTDNEFNTDDSSIDFTMIKALSNDNDGSNLALSLDWDNAVNNSGETQIGVSYSDGSVGVYVLAGDGLREIKRWKAHDFEAWICAFNYYNTNVLYTGGDDCRLKVWDLRGDCSSANVVSKQHEMGVCSVQQNFHHENILATGSYDERVLFWDQRNMRKPLEEVKVRGGVWRVKWEPQKATQVVVAAMHGGFCVIDCASLCGKTSRSEQGFTSEIVASYQHHDSLAYGVDWFKGTSKKKKDQTYERLIASCSFYDCLLNLWTLDV